MAIRVQEKHLFISTMLIVALTAFLIEPSYFVTTIIVIGAIAFILKTEKLKYYLLVLGIILTIFIYLLQASWRHSFKRVSLFFSNGRVKAFIKFISVIK